MLTYNQI